MIGRADLADLRYDFAQPTFYNFGTMRRVVAGWCGVSTHLRPGGG